MSGRGLIDVVYSSRCRSSGFILGDFANQLKRKKRTFLNVIIYGAKNGRVTIGWCPLMQ